MFTKIRTWLDNFAANFATYSELNDAHFRPDPYL